MITYERRYTGQRGKVAHLMSPSYIFGRNNPTALCGLWAWHADMWHGTGSQDEYERAEALPTCKTCQQKAKP